MKSTFTRTRDADQRWLIYDASEHVLGKMAAAIASQLMGKDRPEYTPGQLTGAHVVVLNAGRARLSGVKSSTKEYDHYSGYQGGLKTVPLERVIERRPRDVVRLAVKRMLPKTTLGRDMLRRLRVYEGTEHPHEPQKPRKVTPEEIR